MGVRPLTRLKEDCGDKVRETFMLNGPLLNEARVIVRGSRDISTEGYRPMTRKAGAHSRAEQPIELSS